MTETSILGLHLYTVLGALFILLGTLLIHSGNQLKSKVKIETLEDNLVKLKTDNQVLSEKLTSTSLELNKSVMGDGYSIFGLTGRKENNNYYGSLESVSDYNIYDIKLMVTDFDKAIKCKTKKVGEVLTIDHDCYFQNTKADEISGIPTKSVHFPNYFITTKEKRKHLEIKITSRNTRTVQHSVFELNKGGCVQSYKLYQFDGKKWALVKESNPLGVSENYWNEHFYPMENRRIDIL